MPRQPRPRRTRESVLLLIVATMMAVLAGCERTPEEAPYDNLFDPGGPTGGDGLGLIAFVVGNDIQLQWSQPHGQGIVEYSINHSTTSISSGYTALDSVEPADGEVNIYLYTDPEPNKTHFFQVQALAADGGFSLTSYATPRNATIGPRIVLGAGDGRIAARQNMLQVVVGRGDSLRIALGPDYLVEQRVAAADSGVTLTVPIDLGPHAQDDSVHVRAISFDDSWTSVPSFAAGKVAFSPAIALARGGFKVASLQEDIAVSDAGVVQMRFADSEAGLAAAAWVPGAALFEDFPLTLTTAPQSIWAEFEGDFGYNATDEISVTPDLLGGAGFSLGVPQDRITSQSTVKISTTGIATEVRFAESPDLAAVPWQAMPDSLQITFSPGAGRKTIYLQLRNDWSDSAVLSDYAFYISQGIEVAIVAPGDGQTILSGIPLLVRGSAAAGAGTAAVDSVFFDADDGTGFRGVTGAEDWSYLWTVPSVTEDTVLNLRARAYAGGDSATTSVMVTVAP